MKNNKVKTNDKEFDTVKTFREIKEKISSEISEMDFEQIKEYLALGSQKFKLKKGM